MIPCVNAKEKSQNNLIRHIKVKTVISRFKNNDGEYLKIKKTVEEEVIKLLTDSKVILQFPLTSVFESIRRNPGKPDNLVFNYRSTSSTLTSTPAQDSLLSHIEGYRDMILDESTRLYDMLLTHLTNTIMDNADGAPSNSTVSLPSSSTFTLGRYDQDGIYRIEEPQNFDDSKDDIAD